MAPSFQSPSSTKPPLATTLRRGGSRSTCLRHSSRRSTSTDMTSARNAPSTASFASVAPFFSIVRCLLQLTLLSGVMKRSTGGMHLCGSMCVRWRASCFFRRSGWCLITEPDGWRCLPNLCCAVLGWLDCGCLGRCEPWLVLEAAIALADICV